ncbi:hypothetical protein BC829DRAFT_417372 [Chytridium lagenaria]|nr:hypothetical protein BC829DRAFT_417372 [Chytridium lagenaria]
MAHGRPRSAFAAAVVRIPWQAILQRVPGSLIFFSILFSIFGPALAPYGFAVFLVGLHTVVMIATVEPLGEPTLYARRPRKLRLSIGVQKYCDVTGAVDGHDPRHDLPFEQVMHVIIIPNYKENMDTLCETLDILASHSRAPTNYKVCLAMEETEPGSEEKARSLMRLYADHFYDIVYTIHPKDMPGEIRGKSSNSSWGARQMSRLSKDPKMATPEVRRLQMFSPCTVFDRNSNDVVPFVRQTDVMWSLAVMSNMYPSSPVCFPCSAYSVSMELLQAVDFWDVGPEGIGEDMHMYLKCFFVSEGRVVLKPIYSPASQCNIEGEGFWGGVNARYTQAKRHLWGCLDTGYAIRRSIHQIFAPGYEHTMPRDEDRKGKKADGTVAKPTDPTFDLIDIPFSMTQLGNLIYRLLEAHIILGHFAFCLAFWESLTTESIHPFLLFALDICGWIRFFAIFPLLSTIRTYEHYHHWVGIERWRLSALGNAQPPGRPKVQPLGRRAQLKSVRTMWCLLDWCTLPLTGLMFHTFPQVHAQIAQLWTNRLDYKVAAKPSLSKPSSHTLNGGEEVALSPLAVNQPLISSTSPSRLSSSSSRTSASDAFTDDHAASRRVDLDLGFDGVTVMDHDHHHSSFHGGDLSSYYHSRLPPSALPPAPPTSVFSAPSYHHHHSSSISSVSTATTAVAHHSESGSPTSSPLLSSRWMSIMDDAVSAKRNAPTSPTSDAGSVVGRSPSISSSHSSATAVFEGRGDRSCVERWRAVPSRMEEKLVVASGVAAQMGRGGMV